MPEKIVPDEPGERECLRCYIRRMLRFGGCDNTRKWTTRWRDRRVPGGVPGGCGVPGGGGVPGGAGHASGGEGDSDGELLSRLEDRGGLCCDCEVLLNVWEDLDDARWPEGCAGVVGADPLTLCAGWAGSFPRDPVDPYDYDDDWEEGFTPV